MPVLSTLQPSDAKPRLGMQRAPPTARNRKRTARARNRASRPLEVRARGTSCGSRGRSSGGLQMGVARMTEGPRTGLALPKAVGEVTGRKGGQAGAGVRSRTEQVAPEHGSARGENSRGGAACASGPRRTGGPELEQRQPPFLTRSRAKESAPEGGGGDATPHPSRAWGTGRGHGAPTNSGGGGEAQSGRPPEVLRGQKRAEGVAASSGPPASASG